MNVKTGKVFTEKALRTQTDFIQFLNESYKEDGSRNLITDPMQQHIWFNACVSKIAKTIARAPFKIYFGDQEDENSEIAQLFMNPNAYTSRYQLWEATAAWLNMDGEAIWTFGADYAAGIPKQIIVSNPRYFKHTLSKNEDSIVLWTYEKGNIKIPFLPDEIIHFRDWNHIDPWRGKNPALAGMRNMNQDFKAMISNMKLLENNAIVPGLLRSEARISPEQAKEIKEEWKRKHAGYLNHYDIAVMGNGLEYQDIGLKPADMQYMEMMGWNRDAIMARMGVPPGVLGISAKNTPLSGEEKTASMKMFWNETIIPILKSLEDKLRRDFFIRHKQPKFYGEFDLSEIPELQEDDNKRSERDARLITLGKITINESREADGLEPVPWGYTWWKPMGLVKVDDYEAPQDREPINLPPGNQEPPKKEDDEKGIAFLFSRTKTLYTPVYRNKHWWSVIGEWENIEDRYRKQLQAWFKGQRGEMLQTLYQKSISDLEKFFDEDFWTKQLETLRVFSRENFNLTLEAVGNQLAVLFNDLGVDRSFSIYDTRAITLLDNRVNKGNLERISTTMRGQVIDAITAGQQGGFTEDEIGDAIRAVYNRAGNRANTIARTELGGVISDSRIESFKEVGFPRHSWLSAQDGNVRSYAAGDEFDHTMDGETVKIGQKFSNGLTQPMDPAGDAGNVINCRCLTLPED